LAVPVFVLLVPQGVQGSRTWVLESIFILACLLPLMLVLLRVVLGRATLPKQLWNPVLAIALVYFGVINAGWSLLRGNAPGNVATVVLPFVLLGLYYLFAFHKISLREAQRLVVALIVSGVLLAGVVIVNFFVADLTAYDMRSAQIEDDRNLALPLLCMAGVLAATYALLARSITSLLMATIASLAIVVAILMTVTRGLLISYVLGLLVVAGVLVIWSPGGVRRTVIVRLGVGLGLGFLCALPFVAAWLVRLDLGNERDFVTIAGRLDEYAAFGSAFLASPIIGVGMGTVIVDPTSFVNPLGFEGITRCHSHLFFFAAMTGVVGVVMYYSLSIAALLKLFRACRRNEVARERLPAAAGMFGAGVAGFVYTASTTMYTTLSYNVFWAVLIYFAWLLGSARSEQESDGAAQARG
jgi:O-antigen ligase